MELGLVTFSETNNWVLAALISDVQSFLSSSVAESAEWASVLNYRNKDVFLPA